MLARKPVSLRVLPRHILRKQTMHPPLLAEVASAASLLYTLLLLSYLLSLRFVFSGCPLLSILHRHVNSCVSKPPAPRNGCVLPDLSHQRHELLSSPCKHFISVRRAKLDKNQLGPALHIGCVQLGYFHLLCCVSSVSHFLAMWCRTLVGSLSTLIGKCFSSPSCAVRGVKLPRDPMHA